MAKRTYLDVLYADGTEASLPVRPVGLIAAERRYSGKEMPRLEATLYAAWFGLVSPKASFDDWVATLEGIDEHDEQAGPLEKSEPSASTSPESQPEPE